MIAFELIMVIGLCIFGCRMRVHSDQWIGISNQIIVHETNE